MGSDALMPAVVGQSVPAQSLAPYVPDALTVVGRILTGKLRASVAVRANVALRVIEMHREDCGGAFGDDAPEAGALGRLAEVLTLRRRTVEAVAVEPVSPVSRGDDVAPAPAAQS